MLDSPVCSPIRSSRPSSFRACSLTASVVAAQLEDPLARCTVLALELARAAVLGHVVDALVHLHARLARRAGLRRADQGAMLAGEGDGVAAAGQADLLGDLGDRADVE